VKSRLLAAVAIAAGLTPLNSTMIAVALPALSAEFGAAASRVTLWVVTGYLVATILSQIPAGRVADRLGYARVLTLGRWIFAGGAIAAIAAPSIAVVVLGRFLMAAGGALMVPTAMALLRVSVPPERRARAFGSMGAVMAGSAAVGPALGGLIIASFSWRALFVVNLPLLILSWLLQPASVASDAVASGGAAASGSPERRSPEREGGRRKETGYGFGLLRTSAFAAGASIVALQNLAMYALMFQLPFLIRGTSGEGARQIGFAIMTLAATMALSSPVGGWLADRVGVTPVALAGGLLGATGLAALTLLQSYSLASVAGWLVLVGAGIGISTGPSQASALTAIDPSASGTASAMMSLLRYVGGITGTTVLSIALGANAADLSRQHVAMWVFVAAFLASAACAARLAPLARQPQESRI
jgi:MFS family permease